MTEFRETKEMEETQQGGALEAEKQVKLTARRLTEIIVNKFDQLMRDSQYKVKKEHKPKFEFDRQAVA